MFQEKKCCEVKIIYPGGSCAQEVPCWMASYPQIALGLKRKL